jgi:protein-disulfide isomerase
MSAGKALTLALALGLLTNGSTCRGQSGGEASKDPGNVVDVNLAEVDTSALTPREKREWSSAVGELLAPCKDVPVSVAQCVQEKRACPRCVPAAKMLAKMVRDGKSREQMEKAFHNRFDPDKVRNVDPANSPSRGPSSAPITMIEFADFTCPHCQAMAPKLDKMWEKKRDQVRFVYKFLPLSGPGHERGEPAARAAIAAMNQGKFWEMHQKLFEAEGRLDQSDLERMAKELGLDLAKFRADMEAKETKERIEADKKLADALEIKGTPTIYVNGRLYDGSSDLEDWIALELQMMGAEKPPMPTTPPPSAAPSASAAPAGSK